MNYYELLEVNINSNENEIKEAFRKKAKLLHPDINNNGDEEFIKIREAYDTLIDQNKRKEYDGKIIVENEGYISVKKIYKDIRIGINLTVKEAITGLEKKVVVKRIINGSIIDEEIEVLIPPMTNNMEIMKISNKGNEITNKKEKIIGDLFVILRHEEFEDGFYWKNKSLHTSVEVPFYYLLLEKTINISVLSIENVLIKLESNKQNYKKHLMFYNLPIHIEVLPKYIPKHINIENKEKLSKILEDIYG